jgi:uncharacterized protein
MSFTKAQQQCLLETARAAIIHGLDKDAPMPVRAADYEDALRALRATFVTLNNRQGLRGCIGTLRAYQPLIEDVAYHAYAAAFEDPRFPPLRREELVDLRVHISVLSESEAMTFQSEADLIRQLRPGVDGLILSEGARRGTFLPSVWESLPIPADFLRHLKNKAGLAADYWSSDLRVERYTVDFIE